MSTTEWHGVYGGDHPTIDEYDELVADLRVDADTVQSTAHAVPFGALIWAGRTIREQANEIERLRAELALFIPTTEISVCPKHGSALCPQHYMLNARGEPWPNYVDAWNESLRCEPRTMTTLYRKEAKP